MAASEAAHLEDGQPRAAHMYHARQVPLLVQGGPDGGQVLVYMRLGLLCVPCTGKSRAINPGKLPGSLAAFRVARISRGGS